MKKTTIIRLLGVTAGILLLAGCGEQESGRGQMPDRAEEETPQATEEAAPTEAETGSGEEAVQPTEAAEPTAAEPVEATPTETEDEDIETSPVMLWEYEGYVDECREYTWWKDFADCDFDGDGKTDRVYRTHTADTDLATYTIEFGNGRSLTTPEGWNTGFPHVQAGDLNGDGEPEILFTMTYDTSTDPLAFGDLWLFAWDGSAYAEEKLPLAAGENGAKCLTLDYQKTSDTTVAVQVAQNGFECEVSAGADELAYWYYGDAKDQNAMVYYAVLETNGKAHLHCYAEMFSKSAQCLEFDLVSKGDGYAIENMKYMDEAYFWWE